MTAYNALNDKSCCITTKQQVQEWVTTNVNSLDAKPESASVVTVVDKHFLTIGTITFNNKGVITNVVLQNINVPAEWITDEVLNNTTNSSCGSDMVCAD